MLALYSGVSSGLISKIENKKRGKPKTETLQKLAKGLKMEYSDLMKEAGFVSVVNEQALNEAMEIYNRLPHDKKKLIDDMLKALNEE